MAFVGNGLRPYRRLDSAALNFLVNNYQMAYNQASSLGTGDVVIPLSTGYVGAASTGSNPVLGIYNYVSYPNPTNTIQPQGQRLWNNPGLASNVTVQAYVWDDPNIVFAAGVTSTSTLTQSCIGYNINFVSNFTPNTTTGISTLALDSTSVATTSTLPFRIVELVPISGNSFSATNPILGVVLNNSFYRTSSGV